MRLTLDPTDSAYQRYEVNPCYVQVLLDGKEPPGPVLTADSDVDLIVHYVWSKQGNYLEIDPATDTFITQIAYGKVEIKLNRDERGGWPHGVPDPEALIPVPACS